VQQSEHTLAGMKATVVVVPLLFLGLSCVAMMLNPLGREARRESKPQPEAA
jgi:Na+/melibiose symporter-like transporter